LGKPQHSFQTTRQDSHRSHRSL